MSRFSATLRRALHAIVRPLKAAGRSCERTLARRLSERYAGEITQFDALARAMRELGQQVHARLDKQEGFQWDHVALARRLARLEDHVEQLLRQADRGLVPGGASDDRDGPATRAGTNRDATIAGMMRMRQAIPGLMPGGERDGIHEPATRAAATSEAANAASCESDRVECIPFPEPMRYAQAKTSSQEAA